MALQSSGPISISDIKTELGSSNNDLRALSAEAGFSTPDGMDEFYGYSAVTEQYYLNNDTYLINDGTSTFTGSNFTFSGWFRVDSVSKKGQHFFSVGRAEFDNRNTAYGFYYSSLNRIQIAARDSSGNRTYRREYALHNETSITGISSSGTGWVASQRGNTDANGFVHIVMTYDFTLTSPSALNVYWNGQVLNPVINESGASLANNIYSTKYTALKLGYVAASSTDKFFGGVDNISWWPYTFTAAHVADLYSKGNMYVGDGYVYGGNTYTPIAANGFDGNLTNTAYNRAGSGNLTTAGSNFSFQSY